MPIDEQNIRLAEREELGRELHDTTLAQLSTLSWTLDNLRQTLPQPTSAQQLLLHQAENQRNNACANCAALSTTSRPRLHPPNLPPVY
ncbi:MAG: hypothetical protein IPL28_18215 [Chloroflexi bacterium]|nr:hypothetical protein [Chloroflexota bacterium]